MSVEHGEQLVTLVFLVALGLAVLGVRRLGHGPRRLR